MTFEDLFNLNTENRVSVYWDLTSELIFSGFPSDLPKETLDKVKTRKVTGITASEYGALVIKLDETFEDLLDKYPELLEFNVEIYIGKVLAFANNLSKIPSEFLLNLKQRSVIEFTMAEGLQKAIIAL